MSTKILINTTTHPISARHISWTVQDMGHCLVLYEIIENYYEYPDYEYPDSKGYSLISKLEMTEKKRVLKSDTLNSAPLFQLLNSINTIRLVYPEGE